MLPGRPDRAVASLILNQASFAVQDALHAWMADLARPLAPTLVAGLPTLGLGPAAAVARALGHPRFLALGTSVKFWYDEALSEPLGSVTTPGTKRLYLDPRLLPLLEDARVLLVDDVVSSGRSAAAALRLLARVGVEPVGIVAAMLQTEVWRAALDGVRPGTANLVRGVFASPLLGRGADGLWHPTPDL